MSDYRSVSQLKTWEGCPHQYYLERKVKAWQRPAAWLAQGTAVHEAVEQYERSGRLMSEEDAQDVFREAYAREIDRMAVDTPNLDYWFSSGPYRGAADIDRRYGIGLDQTAGYVEYIKSHPEDIIWTTPDGILAIELEFLFDLDGVAVRGFIDQVIQYVNVKCDPPLEITGGGEIRVRDVKTGNKPGDVFQLKVYALAIEELAGIDVLSGDYWMGRNKNRKGGPTKPYDLTEITRGEVVDRFHRMDAEEKAGNYEPKPDPDKCRFCSVRTACSFSAR